MEIEDSFEFFRIHIWLTPLLEYDVSEDLAYYV